MTDTIESVANARGRLTYGSEKTTAEECIWYSPACHRPNSPKQVEMFA